MKKGWSDLRRVALCFVLNPFRYGKWGYGFGRSPFNVQQKDYQAAVHGVQHASLDDLCADFQDVDEVRWHPPFHLPCWSAFPVHSSTVCCSMLCILRNMRLVVVMHAICIGPACRVLCRF